MQANTFTWPFDPSGVVITWRTVHPLHGTKEVTLRAGDPLHARAIELLRYAGFPREPVTFAYGRQYMVPDATLGTLAVQTPFDARSVTYDAHEFPLDAGYAPLFKLLNPPPPRAGQARFTMPTPEQIELRYKVGSPHAGIQRYLLITRGGQSSVSTLREPRGREQPESVKRVLDAATLDRLHAALGTIDWTRDTPPFDAQLARLAHTPAEVVLRSARDDEPYAGVRLAWQQRFAEPRWAVLFNLLDWLAT